MTGRALNAMDFCIGQAGRFSRSIWPIVPNRLTNLAF
jgi:hypothetical protein